MINGRPSDDDPNKTPILGHFYFEAKKSEIHLLKIELTRIILKFSFFPNLNSRLHFTHFALYTPIATY